MRPFRVAYLVTHPIQYQAPLLRRLAAHPEIELQVYFMDRQGASAYRDPEFGVSVQWDTPVLDGYAWHVLRNVSPWPAADHAARFINPELVGRLRRERYDALIVHGYAHATEWLAFLGGRLSGTPLLLRGESTLLGRGHGWKDRVKRRLRTALLRRVHGVLAIGRRNREFYRAHGVPDSRIFFVPYAVDNEWFFAEAARHRDSRKALRARLGWPDDSPVVLLVGKLIPRKRPMDLLEAYAGIVPEVPVGLVYLGDGVERERLTEAAAARGLSHVHVTGFVNQREIPAYYAAADVLVLPSEHEPWGLALNEGMCFGLPVIASDMVGAAPDLVLPGENGFVYPVGDVNGLRRCLRRLLSDAAERARMGSRSREIVAEYSYEADVRGIVDALRAVVGSNPEARVDAPTARTV